MTNFERYQAGQHEQVWRELLELGGRIRQEPLYSDALAVAGETMNRVKFNMELIRQRLKELNYHFVDYGPAYYQHFKSINLPAVIGSLEAAGALFPLSLKLFYEKVGWMDFRGWHPRLSGYFSNFGASKGSGYESDPLVVEPPHSDDIEDYRCLYVDGELVGYDEELAAVGDEPCYFIEIAPDRLHKANVSGGDPYYIKLGNPAIDALVEGGDIYYGSFIDYLRLSLKWGGFPGLAAAPAQARKAEAELNFLTKNMLPF